MISRSDDEMYHAVSDTFRRSDAEIIHFLASPIGAGEFKQSSVLLRRLRIKDTRAPCALNLALNSLR